MSPGLVKFSRTHGTRDSLLHLQMAQVRNARLWSVFRDNSPSSRGVIDDCKTNVQVNLFRAIFEKGFVSGHHFSRAIKSIRTKALESRENSSFTNLVPKGRLNFRAVQVSELTMFGVPFIH